MDLLAAQFNTGHLALDEIKTVLGSDFGNMWPTLQKKFKTDANGLFYNERLKEEKEKRQNFTESRRNNLLSKKDKTPEAPELPLDTPKETIEERAKTFSTKILTDFTGTYEGPMLNDFIRYWTEYNEGGKKMRFEMERVFDHKKRLVTWKKNDFKNNSYARGQQKNGKANTSRGSDAIVPPLTEGQRF